MLIATGLLMFAFVGYQLWGTGLEYARAQDRLDEEFDELIGSTTTTSTPPTTAATPPTVDDSTTSTTSTTIAPPPTVPDFTAGDVMARLEIPIIALDAKVVSGVAPDDLKQGPGHYPDTPMPGQFGNSAIAGHRTTYGQPFYRLDEVTPGDEIVVTTVQGRFVYRATTSEIVEANRSDVVATTDPTVARLTLTTCDPRYSATRRLIVSADLDEAASAAPQAPIVEEQAPATTPDNAPVGRRRHRHPRPSRRPCPSRRWRPTSPTMSPTPSPTGGSPTTLPSPRSRCGASR